MFRTYATPLELDVQFSKYFLYFFVLIIFLSVSCLVIVPVPFVVKILAVSFVVFISSRQYLIFQQPKRIIWHEQNNWKIIEMGCEHECELLNNSFIMPWLAILNLKLANNKTKSVVIFKDAIDKEQFRKLRVRLKVEAHKIFKKNKESHAKI